jgi:hypothetical protein
MKGINENDTFAEDSLLQYNLKKTEGYLVKKGQGNQSGTYFASPLLQVFIL